MENAQNLIEIQSALQDPTRVTMQDLFKYANGTNPQVPSFLALMELNRRKQIEQTAMESERPQGTVKDQTIAALLGRQQPMANPTLPPQGASLGASPPNMVNPTAMPKQVMPGQAPQQVNPAAQPMRAASGGLMAIPVNNMFKAKNYASGGIVAFKDGGNTDSRREEMDRPPRETYRLGDQEIQGPRSHEEILAGLPGIAPLQATRPADMTIEQAVARRKEIQKAAGVSEDPYAEVRRYQEGIEARQAEERKGNAIDRLLAQAEAFATADPTKGFGYQAGVSSKASRTLEAEQRAIREKQDAVNMDFRRNMAKEADARARGDADGIAAALKQQKDDQAAFDKLQMDWDRLEQGRHTTAASVRQSDISAAKMPVDIFQAQTQRQQAETQREQAETQRRQGESLADYQRRMAAVAERNAKTSEQREQREQQDRALERKNAQFEREPFIQNMMRQLRDPLVTPEDQAKLIREYNRHKRAYFAAELRKNPELQLNLLDESMVSAPPPARDTRGWWDRLRNNPPGPSGAATPSSNAVPFDQLPTK